MVFSLNRLHVNVTTNLQSLIYIFLVLLGFVNYNRKLTCGKLLFWDKTLTHYHHRTMSTWNEYEKSISAWIHRIRTKRIQAPGRPSLLTLNHPPTLEASTCATEMSCLPKIYTQLDSLPLKLLNNIGMRNVGLVHHNKLKLVLVQITQHHPVICVYMSYKLKYMPFNYFMHYDHIEYVWADRCLTPHKYDHKRGK